MLPVIVIETITALRAKQCPLLAPLIRIARKFCRHRGIAVVEYSMDMVRRTLLPDGARITNDLLFRLVASQFNQLADYLPKVNRYQGDNLGYYGPMFFATALGLTWLRRNQTPYAYASVCFND